LADPVGVIEKFETGFSHRAGKPPVYRSDRIAEDPDRDIVDQPDPDAASGRTLPACGDLPAFDARTGPELVPPSVRDSPYVGNTAGKCPCNSQQMEKIATRDFHDLLRGISDGMLRNPCSPAFFHGIEYKTPF
jgi:hypothetical protein